MKQDVRLHVETMGQGPGVVFLHGFGGSARNFRRNARQLVSSCSVACFDLRGHARSQAPSESKAYRAECLLNDVAQVSDGLSSDPVVLIGLSLGASLALQFALTHPSRVAGLVLAAYPAPGTQAWALGLANDIETLGLDAAGARWVWGTTSRFDPQGAELIRRGFLEHSPTGLVGLLREYLAVQPSLSDLAGSLAQLRVPVKLIVGEDDRGSLEASRQLKSLLPDAPLEVIPGAGHVVNLGAPERFDAAVAEFLRDIDFGRSAHPSERRS